MRYTAEHKQQTRERVLKEAASAIRMSGPDRVAVAAVMARAGLTHGGFYAHFASREALLAEALEHAGGQSNGRLRERVRVRTEAGESPLSALVNEYLSAPHMEALELGCPVAAVSSELQRAPDALREVSRSRVRGLVAVVEAALGPDVPAGSGWAIAASLVGAIQMARVLGPDGGGDEVLRGCRDAVLAQYDRPGRSA